MHKRSNFQKSPQILYVPGRNATKEAILSGHALEVYCLPRFEDDSLAKFAKESGIKVVTKEEKELSRLVGGEVFQGFVTKAKMPRTYSLQDLIEHAKNKPRSVIAVLDGIEDPHNLGAILRSADGFGIDGIITKNVRGVGITPTVAKTSTGALFYVPMADVTNLHQAIRKLKDEGYWIIATADSAAQNLFEFDPPQRVAVMIGSEGKGVSHLLLSNADFNTCIPMKGHVSCLNASVAAAVSFAYLTNKF